MTKLTKTHNKDCENYTRGRGKTYFIDLGGSLRVCAVVCGLWLRGCSQSLVQGWQSSTFQGCLKARPQREIFGVAACSAE
eukprot:6443659-Amphidinium_carterae.1